MSELRKMSDTSAASGAPAVVIRAATGDDAPAIVAIAREVVADGTTYLFRPDTTDDELRAFWLSPQVSTFVATVGGEVAGCYGVRANYPGRASHVANAAYIVAARFAGRGVGHAMGRHSLDEARSRGFRAMQFNFVVSTNAPAIALCKKLGFEIAGTLRGAFDHPKLGFVDAHVMYRSL